MKGGHANIVTFINSLALPRGLFRPLLLMVSFSMWLTEILTQFSQGFSQFVGASSEGFPSECCSSYSPSSVGPFVDGLVT